MNLNDIINNAMNHIQSNLVGSVAAGVIVLFLLVKRPKLLFILLILFGVGIGFILIYDKLLNTGL